MSLHPKMGSAYPSSTCCDWAPSSKMVQKPFCLCKIKTKNHLVPPFREAGRPQSPDVPSGCLPGDVPCKELRRSDPAAPHPALCPVQSSCLSSQPTPLHLTMRGAQRRTPWGCSPPSQVGISPGRGSEGWDICLQHHTLRNKRKFRHRLLISTSLLQTFL